METKAYIKAFYEYYDEDGLPAACERQDMVGCSHHTIDIFRKNT